MIIWMLHVTIKNNKNKPNTKLLGKANEAKSFIRSIDRRNENVYKVISLLLPDINTEPSKRMLDLSHMLRVSLTL